MCRYLVIFAVALMVSNVAGQVKRANNPYAPSPVIESLVVATTKNVVAKPPSRSPEIKPVIVTIPAPAPSGALTSFYKIGVGDTVYVNLVNTAGASGNYTVRPDGTIDLAIVGSAVQVAGKTTTSAAGIIARLINVYTNPQVEVKITRFGSHKVEVFGLVERSGEKSIQREAVPLYVIKADAGVDPKATKVILKRASRTSADIFQLKDAATDDMLILPGDSVEFG